MSLLTAITIFVVYAIIIILTYRYVAIQGDWGLNHCGIVTSNSSGGDIHFMDMSEDEITTRLKSDYYVFRDWKRPCVNAKDPSHLVEYRYITKMGNVKTIGYITKDKVVFGGRTYIFSDEK